MTFGKGSAIMDLVLKAPTERMEIVLKSLHTDLDRIVMLYNDNNIYYDRRDLRNAMAYCLS